MASSGKLEREEEMKSSAEKFWSAIRDNTASLAQTFPEVFKSIEILEGDGKSVGSIRRINYAEGAPISFAIERIETVDDANMIGSSSIIDGDLMGRFFNKLKGTVQVIPKGEGSLLKWLVEFDKSNEAVPDPTAMLDFVIKTFRDVDAYLLKA